MGGSFEWKLRFPENVPEFAWIFDALCSAKFWDNCPANLYRVYCALVWFRARFALVTARSEACRALALSSKSNRRTCWKATRSPRRRSWVRRRSTVQIAGSISATSRWSAADDDRRQQHWSKTTDTAAENYYSFAVRGPSVRPPLRCVYYWRPWRAETARSARPHAGHLRPLASAIQPLCSPALLLPLLLLLQLQLQLSGQRPVISIQPRTGPAAASAARQRTACWSATLRANNHTAQSICLQYCYTVTEPYIQINNT